MNQDRKLCPYCGEEIAAAAKKCRFCDEWLPEAEATAAPVSRPTVVMQPPVEIADAPAAATTVAVDATRRQAEQPVATAGYAPTMQQPIINVQLNNETTVSQQATQTVVVNKGGSGSSGWLWTQLLAVGGGVWGFTGLWWAGLLTFFGLAILLFIPVVGHLLCIVLGALVGLFCGLLAMAFDAPEWACWVIGAVIGLGTIAGNLSQREEDVNDED